MSDRLLHEVLEARTPDRSARPGSTSAGPTWLETLDAIDAGCVDVRDSEDLVQSTNGIFR